MRKQAPACIKTFVFSAESGYFFRGGIAEMEFACHFACHSCLDAHQKFAQAIDLIGRDERI